MAADLSPRTKPRLNVGLIGDLGHGKTMLAAALAARAAVRNWPNPLPWRNLIAPYRELRYADAETPARHYTLIDCPGHLNYLKNTISGLGLMDAAILVVSAHEGVRPGTRWQLMLA